MRRLESPGAVVGSPARPWCGTAVAASLLLLGGCGADPAGGDHGEAHGHDDGVVLGHVHGLGVDPADGTLHAGTHAGLVRLPRDAAPTLVADRVQDLMGFTVVGPGHFLASGHPGPGAAGPADLGLIETTDGGRTWTPLSLEGAADFHALDAARGLVYGVSRGRLLVGAGGVDWTDRGAAPVADLAVDPADPQRLLATTEDGLVVSADGGQTFAAVPAAPLLLLVDVAADGRAAAGVAPDGTVHGSTDGGRTWSRRGDVGGPPQAVTVEGADVHVAVAGAVLTSTDGGASFTVAHPAR